MDAEAPEIIDTNCYLGNWPTRRLGTSSAQGLAGLAADNGVSTCLVSPLDAIFHKDTVSANSELRREITPFRKHLVPVPIFNPPSPVVESVDTGLVRIIPTHHRYSVKNRALRRFMAGLESGGRVLLISIRMRDERLSHPMLRTRAIHQDDLVQALEPFPDLPMIVNNARSGEIERILQGMGDNVRVGCAWSLPVGFIERMVDSHGDRRMVFGSNVPLHYYQSSLLQINGADIPRSSRERILEKNAAELIRKARG